MLDGSSEGIAKTHCFHLLPQEEWIGESREKPSISPFHGTVVATPPKQGLWHGRASSRNPAKRVDSG